MSIVVLAGWGGIVAKMRFNLPVQKGDRVKRTMEGELPIILNYKIDVSILRFYWMPSFFSLRYIVARLT